MVWQSGVQIKALFNEVAEKFTLMFHASKWRWIECRIHWSVVEVSANSAKSKFCNKNCVTILKMWCHEMLQNFSCKFWGMLSLVWFGHLQTELRKVWWERFEMSIAQSFRVWRSRSGRSGIALQIQEWGAVSHSIPWREAKYLDRSSNLALFFPLLTLQHLTLQKLVPFVERN